MRAGQNFVLPAAGTARPPTAHRLLDGAHHSRVMTWIMAIMLFLTVIAAALGLATTRGVALLDRQLAGRLTVQVVDPDATRRDRQVAAILDALRRLPEVRRAAAVDRAALAALIRPWLGADGADPDLPLPALIDVDLASGSGAAATGAPVARVRAALARVAPAARVDAHESAMAPVRGLMTGVTWLAAGLVLLMGAATGAVVILVATAGLETHRDTIDVLHMLGSTDIQVARLFQRRIAVDTLVGGVAGTVAALVVIVMLGARLAGIGSDLIADVTLGARDWLLLALLPPGFALLATLAARLTVVRALRHIL